MRNLVGGGKPGNQRNKRAAPRNSRAMGDVHDEPTCKRRAPLMALREIAMLKKLFPAGEFVPDARTNSIVVRADEKTLEEVRALVARLDSIESPPKR